MDTHTQTHQRGGNAKRPLLDTLEPSSRDTTFKLLRYFTNSFYTLHNGALTGSDVTGSSRRSLTRVCPGSKHRFVQKATHTRIDVTWRRIFCYKNGRPWETNDPGDPKQKRTCVREDRTVTFTVTVSERCSIFYGMRVQSRAEAGRPTWPGRLVQTLCPPFWFNLQKNATKLLEGVTWDVDGRSSRFGPRDKVICFYYNSSLPLLPSIIKTL